MSASSKNMEMETDSAAVAIVPNNTYMYFEIAVRTATRYGYNDGARKSAQAALSKKRAPHLKELRALSKREETLFSRANDLDELKRDRNQIIGQRAQKKEEMKADTEAERARVGYCKELLAMLDDDVRDALRDAGLYEELEEVHPELDVRVQQRIKEKKKNKNKNKKGGQ